MNAFDRHNIDHLSASSCNLFAVQPALWVAEKLLKLRAPVGAAAHRGSAVEAGVTYKLLNPEKSMDDCIEEADQVFLQKTALCGDPKRQFEHELIPAITRNAITELADYGPDVLCQEKIEWQPEELPVPFIGFADYYWPDHGILVDLKTQLRLNSQIKPSHARQVALYAGRLGDNVDARITYATDKRVATYGLENVRDHLDCLLKIARTIERFLAVSTDPQELAGILIPDVDSFYFAEPQARQNAWQLWGV